MNVQRSRTILIALGLGMATVLAFNGQAHARARSNTFLNTFQNNRALADVTGDGKADWIGSSYSGGYYYIAVSDTELNPTRFFRFQGYGRAVLKLFTARTRGYSSRESICAVNKDAWGSQRYLTCWEVNASNSWLDQLSDQPLPSGWSSLDEIAVGDFDGNGVDDIMTYNSYLYAPPNVWSYASHTRSWNAMAWDRGNLATLQNEWGNPPVLFLVGNFADHDYGSEWRFRDDLMVVNRMTGEIRRYDSRRGSGTTVFWWAYSVSGMLGWRDLPYVAEIDGNGYEDLVLWNQGTGDIRFHTTAQVNLTTRRLDALTGVSTGQVGGSWTTIGFPVAHRNLTLSFAKLKDLPSEGGATNRRDDILVHHHPDNCDEVESSFNNCSPTDSWSRYDARFNAGYWWGRQWVPINEKTYWWAYSGLHESTIHDTLGL